eukprot:76921-Rhodomonas_salina.3
MGGVEPGRGRVRVVEGRAIGRAEIADGDEQSVSERPDSELLASQPHHTRSGQRQKVASSLWRLISAASYSTGVCCVL